MIIGVLDYGAGNLKNVCRAITHLGYDFRLVTNAKELNELDKLIIPGVGAFKVAMKQLHDKQLVEPIRELAAKGMPIFGVCLGMQLLFEQSSEFGHTEGLALFKGHIDRIPSNGVSGAPLKVPHIGWNELYLDNAEALVVKGIQPDDAVYFVHSYQAKGYDQEELVAHCLYDGVVLPAIVQKNNVIGCQFHPEKSGEVGLGIFRNFLSNIT